MDDTTFDSVLLVGFGGPERIEDIRPFLANVTRGRPIPAERLDEVTGHYELLGGSPFNRLTRRQAEALQEELRRGGPALPVRVGMRNWHPTLSETLAEMRAQGLRRAVGVILSAQQTEAGWDRYIHDVAEARAAVGAGAPDVVFAPPWPDHPLYLEAMAERLRAALSAARAAGPAPGEPHVICTAHSVPVAMAAESVYAEQVLAAAAAICARAAAPSWSVAYQSRSGNPRDPWLEPDVNDAIRALAGRGVRDVVVIPVGFICDHVEVLFDIGVEAAATAEQCGVRLVRAETVNDHPTFIRMLADIVRGAVERRG
jgi:ferrochelatase